MVISTSYITLPGQASQTFFLSARCGRKRLSCHSHSGKLYLFYAAKTIGRMLEKQFEAWTGHQSLQNLQVVHDLR